LLLLLLLLLVRAILLLRGRAGVCRTTSVSARCPHWASGAIRRESTSGGRTTGHIPTITASTRVSARGRSVLVHRVGIGKPRMIAGPLLALGGKLGPLLGDPAFVLIFAATLLCRQRHLSLVCAIGLRWSAGMCWMGRDRDMGLHGASTRNRSRHGRDRRWIHIRISIVESRWGPRGGGRGGDAAAAFLSTGGGERGCELGRRAGSYWAHVGGG
jgi:hypothetical protein